MGSNGQLPEDDSYRPAIGLWDSTGHQVVPAQAVSVATDSTGQKYGVMNVNASFSASSLAINDPNTTTQKAGVNASGSLQVAGQGTAGTPGGGVVSIQGVAGGTAVPISGSISATNPSVGTDGSAIPTSSTLIGGSDGTNLQPLQVDASKYLKVNVAAGSISANNASVGTDGSAIPTSSTLIGASDGTNLQQLLVESASNRNLRTGIYSGANEATVTGANALKVDGSAVTQPVSGTFWQATQPVSGTVTANAGTGTMNVSQQSAGSVSATLQNAQSGNATGSTLTVTGNSSAIFAVTMTGFTGTVTFQGTSNSVTSNLSCTQLGTTSIVTSVTGSTTTATYLFECSVGGLQTIQAPTTSVTAGTVTVAALAVPVNFAPRNVNANLLAGSNVIGSATIQAASGTALVADQSNTELRVSTYVKTTTAGDTALTLGSATSANSVPVVVASDQGNLPGNVKQLNGTTVSTNSGTSDAGTQRVISAGAATGTKSNVAGATTSTTILASNTARKGAMVYNDSTALLYLDLSGGTASSTSYSVQVPANAFFELPGPNIYNGAITGVWASATGNARVTEWT